MRSAKTQIRDIVVDAIVENKDDLELVTNSNECPIVAKRLFEDV